MVNEDVDLRSKPGVGVMPGSPQGSSRRSSSGAKAKGPKPPKVEVGGSARSSRPIGGFSFSHSLCSLVGKYGPIFTVNIGIHSALVISTWEVAKDCHTNGIAVPPVLLR
ncbi:unnamed protein product [Prunus armeniaca]|uniref:Uncharacterized protein n=1 Tax=Prunus armeniaca TaxID=36596 RepID=A0A6J5U9I7_PRUAR|nr:unnamed protein product [Prunus armeniaca]